MYVCFLNFSSTDSRTVNVRTVNAYIIDKRLIELIDTPVFYNWAPRLIKYRVSVPIPKCEGVN